MNQLIACILLFLRKECQKWPNLLLIIVYEWLNEVVMYIYLHSWVYSAKRKNRPMHFSYGINNTHFDLIKKNYFTGFCSVTNLDLHFVDMNRYASLQRSLVTHLYTVTKTWWQTHTPVQILKREVCYATYVWGWMMNFCFVRSSYYLCLIIINNGWWIFIGNFVHI